MKTLKQYIVEAVGKFCLGYIHDGGNDVMNLPSLQACYSALKKASGLRYYDITTGSNTSEVSGLVEWGGEGGYWANKLESSVKDSRGKREHDIIAKKKSDITKFQ